MNEIVFSILLVIFITVLFIAAFVAMVWLSDMVGESRDDKK